MVPEPLRVNAFRRAAERNSQCHLRVLILLRSMLLQLECIVNSECKRLQGVPPGKWVAQQVGKKDLYDFNLTNDSGQSIIKKKEEGHV